MDPAHKTILQRQHLKLLDNITDYEGISDGLFSAGIITRAMKEKIDNKKGSEMLREILSILPRRGGKAFDAFYQVLVDRGEGDAADLLHPELASQRQAQAPQSSLPAGIQISHQGVPSAGIEEDELPAKWPDESHDPLRLSVVKVTDPIMKAMFEKAKNGGGNAYAMHAPGIFLLISNEDFKEARNRGEKLSDRDGTEIDVVALDNLFSQLGFRVVKKVNQRAQEMMEAVQNQIEKVQATDTCFACAILTHGERGIVFGVDGEKLPLLDVKTAVADHCPLLRGKPKLFFIQACQGKKFDSSNKVSDVNTGDVLPAPKPCDDDHDIHVQRITDKLAGSSFTDASEQTDASPEATVSTKHDVFVAMATIEDFVSWRNTKWGTWFVQAVVYIFSHFAHKYDISQLMRRVNKLISRAETQKGFKQVSTYSSSMINDFYFFPGLSQGIITSPSDVDFSKGKGQS